MYTYVVTYILKAKRKTRRFIMANKVTPDMTIYDVLCLAPENEKVAQVFFDMGMHCLGCPISRGETVAEAAAAHGNDVNELVSKLNAVIG